MFQFLQSIIKDTRANIVAVSAIGAASLVGGAGLAVDAVYWYLWKRQLQQAVDSGALAGAYALSAGRDVTAASTNDIGLNSNTAITVQSVTSPPATGAYAANNTAVEVIATTSKRLPFSSLFLTSPPVIHSRAVAAYVSEGEHCIISLAETGIGVNLAGTADVLLTCGVAANSVDVDAIDLDGTSWLTGSPLTAVGGIEYSDSNIPSTTNLNPYSAAQEDPLASRGLTTPSSPAGCSENNFAVNANESVTLSPGRYCNGLTIRGDAVLSPGVYIIDKGDLKVNSQASITGEGVTIILTGQNNGNVSTLDFAGGADVDLRAPSQSEDATWYNILVYQDQIGAVKDSKLNGDSDFNMEGVVYMPNGPLSFNGSSGQHSECLLMVAYRISISGETSFSNNCPSDYDDIDTSGRRMRIVE